MSNMNPKLNLKFIKECRIMSGLTHQDMSDRLQFKNASTYYKYEKGLYFFKAVHLPVMAQSFGCKIDDFFIYGETGGNENV